MNNIIIEMLKEPLFYFGFITGFIFIDVVFVQNYKLIFVLIMSMLGTYFYIKKLENGIIR